MKSFDLASDCAQIGCALLKPAKLPCRVMSAAQDQIAFSSIGIQRILPTARTSRRLTKCKPEDDRDTNDARTDFNIASTPPHPSGIGRLEHFHD